MSKRSAELLAQRVRDELLGLAGPDVAAIWLYGASVFGHPFVDVDMHILLKRQLGDDQWVAVGDMQVQFAREAQLDLHDLDFWYISLDEAHGSSNPIHLAPWANNLRDDHWPLHRAHWLAGRCNVVHGLEPSAVVQNPTWEELEVVLRRELVAPKPSAYWVLQLCRVWASLATRDVVRSKLDSGTWALERLAREHHGIVRAAMRFYQRKANAGDESLILRRFPALLTEVERELNEIQRG